MVVILAKEGVPSLVRGRVRGTGTEENLVREIAGIVLGLEIEEEDPGPEIAGEDPVHEVDVIDVHDHAAGVVEKDILQARVNVERLKMKRRRRRKIPMPTFLREVLDYVSMNTQL